MKSIVSKLILVAVVATLVACGEKSNQVQYQQHIQPQVAQQQPQVIVQQSPQDGGSSVTSALTGVAIGALAANMFNNRNQAPQVTQHVTEYRNVPVQTQPSTQKPYFKPETLPIKPVVAPMTAQKPVTTPAPKPSFAPASSYKQSAPQVSYSKSFSSSSSSSRRK
jgi:hypothetical protein